MFVQASQKSFTYEKINKNKSALKNALKALGKNNFSLIVHGGSFPSLDGEDTGYGSPNSNGAKALIDFASGVFNSIQLGPAGKTKSIDSSPYTSTIFSNNPMFIDLKQLTQDKWGKILSTKTYNDIVSKNPKRNSGETAYSYAYKAYEDALKEAYQNFKNSNLNDLKEEFENYKKENEYWLLSDSLYEALSVEHNNDYWPNWENELDKNLFNPKNEEQKSASDFRIKELKNKYQDVIDNYAFNQFVVSKQNLETKEYASQKGIKMIADRQVAFSDRDTWAYQSVFLDGWMLGCPPDYFSEDGQAWGFPVINPDTMFNADGTLGKGGELLKRLYSKMFKENQGGVRIDHIVGLIDPWVYKAGKKPKIEEGASRLYSSPEHPELGRFAIAKMENLNHDVEQDSEKRIINLTDEQVQRYGAMIEKIVIASARENGLDKNAIVCEDLGTLTNPVAAVLKRYELLGMRLTQFVVAEDPDHAYRCKNIEANCWAMVGTHDNEPLTLWAKKLVNTADAKPHCENLADDLWSEANANIKNALIDKLSKDSDFLTLTKFVEIFASRAANIQVFFSDLLGLEKVYNKPGTSGDQNWSLRIPNNFIDFYVEQLNKNKGLNLFMVLKLAMEARGAEFANLNSQIIKSLDL